MPCPLCQHIEPQLLATPDKKYYKCPQCWLIYMDKEFFPSSDDEKARYETHNNTLDNQGYVDFLHRMIDPAIPYFLKDMKLLDYGSGPNPVLSQLLKKKSFCCDNYDPFFANKLPSGQYDGVFCVETMEHFFNPQKEIETLTNLLAPNGFLFVMTLFWTDINRFTNWFYRRDLTHVCFYHARTFDFIAKKYGFTIKYTDKKRIVIMQKNV